MNGLMESFSLLSVLPVKRMHRMGVGGVKEGWKLKFRDPHYQVSNPALCYLLYVYYLPQPHNYPMTRCYFHLKDGETQVK